MKDFKDFLSTLDDDFYKSIESSFTSNGVFVDPGTEARHTEIASICVMILKQYHLWASGQL